MNRADFLRVVRRAWGRHARVLPHPQGEFLMSREAFESAAREVVMETVEKFLKAERLTKGD